MAPTNKAKASGVSASSFLDLRAELEEKEEELAKNKALGKSSALVGGVKRPGKKPTVWSKPNAGVSSRAARDVELEAVSKHTLDSARATLERKVKVYEKLEKGETGGLSDAQYGELLVDFDSKPIDAYESDSDDEDESLNVPKPAGDDQDDPMVEYEDEFGRVRTGRRSKIPRHLLKEEEEDIDPFVMYNPQGYFPTYQPSEERLAAIKEQFSEENNPLNVHYDASNEVRAKGAGFYQFSGDEETRKRQMEELRKAREETERTRQETGAVDVLPGEVEGMGEAAEVVPKKSRALEKRRRELEERRKLVNEKRRKKDTGSASNVPTPNPGPSTSPSPGPHLPDSPRRSGYSSAPKDRSTVSPATAVDPFAALEVQTTATGSKGKQKAVIPLNPADAFLANLEKDIMKGMKR